MFHWNAIKMDCQRRCACLTRRSRSQHADATVPDDFAAAASRPFPSRRHAPTWPPPSVTARLRCRPPPSAGRPPASAAASTKLVSPSSMENTTEQSSGVKRRRPPVWSGFPRLGRGLRPARRRQREPVDRLARSFFAMDSRVAYALACMIFLGGQTGGRQRFALELCPVVFSIDDGETSFVGAVAEAGAGGRRRSRAVADGGGWEMGERRRLQNRSGLWHQRAESRSEELRHQR
jgi:hypothetical protein